MQEAHAVLLLLDAQYPHLLAKEGPTSDRYR